MTRLTIAHFWYSIIKLLHQCHIRIECYNGYMAEIFDVLDNKGRHTGETARRSECHRFGYWHKAVAVFILNSANQVLLQQRSATKRLWPGLWDVSAGGHVLVGEFGFQAVIRECREELGLDLNLNELTFIGAAISTEQKADIINNHFNEFYVTHKDLDPTTLHLQTSEVSAVKWVDRDEITQRIQDHYEGITTKEDCWAYLLEYYKWQEAQ